ncbi:MAG: efflux RND transporter periplasmic adaptor subunit [Pleurocapsa sp.]
MKIPIIGRIKHSIPWTIGLTLGGLLLFGSISYLVLKQSRGKVNLASLTVAVTQQDLNVEIEASGRVEPIKSVNVSPKNPARLVRLFVEQGDRVTTGQTLAIMENQELEAQKSQAAAELKRSQANFAEGQTRINAEIAQARARLNQVQFKLQQAQARIPQDIAQNQAQINAAESRLKLVAERLKRNEYLLNQGGIAQDTFDEINNEYQNAQANLKELKQRSQQLETTGGSEVQQLEAEVNEARIALEQKQQNAPNELDSLEAGVDAAQATLEQSTTQYTDSIVKAPFDGIVTQRYAVEGAYVTPSTSASSTASASATSILALAQGLEVVAKVTELDISQLQPGQKVKIVAEAYPEREFSGQVKRIAPEAIVDNDNVTFFEVRIELLSGLDELRSKMNVDATFLGQKLNDTLVVPTVAIVTEQGETGVMILNEDNQPEFKPVKIGLTIGDKTQIIEGIDSQARVFIDLPEKKGSR